MSSPTRPWVPWQQRWQQWRTDRALARRAIPEPLWLATLASLPFLARLSASESRALQRLCSLFLDAKEFHGAGGLKVTDDMAVAIAAQACLPVLHLGLQHYSGFVGIVVHPDEVVARREMVDDNGVVHTWDEWLTGEAMAGGPVMLSWRDVAASGETAEMAYNVVIHEFAHILDLADGQEPDGMPPLADAAACRHWHAVMAPAYDAFCQAVAQGHDTALDPYGAESIDEYFAVASEAFFVSPTAMRADSPEVYRLLAGYYQQDPAAG